MNSNTPTSVDEYINSLPENQKTILTHVRNLVKTVAPDATETISYNMPTFKYKGRPLLHYAAFSKHMSLFPTSGPPNVLKDELTEFSTAKGTIQFTVDKQVPDELITKIVLVRIEEINAKS